MTHLTDSIVQFFQEQGFVIVSTLDAQGQIHCSAKGIASIEEDGHVHLIDLYRSHTFHNLQNNPTASITAVDEHRFVGYTLQGKARIVERDKIEDDHLKKWEQKVIARISKRVIKNIQKQKKEGHHPEAHFAEPQYLIVLDVEKVIDLTPAHLRKPPRD